MYIWHLAYLSIQSVEKRVTSSVSHTTAPVSLTTFTKLETLTPKSPLVDFAILSTTERHPIVLKLW